MGEPSTPVAEYTRRAIDELEQHLDEHEERCQVLRRALVLLDPHAEYVPDVLMRELGASMLHEERLCRRARADIAEYLRLLAEHESAGSSDG